MMTWTVVSGTLIIVFLTVGYVGWVPIAIAVVLGFVLGLPIAKWIGARIKRQDPDWDEVHNRPDPTPDAQVVMDDGDRRRRI